MSLVDGIYNTGRHRAMAYKGKVYEMRIIIINNNNINNNKNNNNNINNNNKNNNYYYLTDNIVEIQ